ncbi:MAG: hypothetical protein DRI84_04640 [Bacteroidetes bacterium]|nr:MAG: hypothetical protein DRI84_04640 [Bacteroidota bacterium]
MEKLVLIDTNLYLDDANIIYKLSKNYDKILIPLMVLKELDDKKYHKDLSYSARNAIRALLDFSTNYPDKAIFDAEEHKGGNQDEKILASAKRHNATIATKDISMSIQAKSLGIESVLHDMILNNIFDPYIHVHMNDLHEVSGEDVFEYDNEYSDEEDYQKMLAIFSKLAGKKVDDDYWWFVIINIDTNNPVIYANNPMVPKLVRIDNQQKYRKIKTDGISIKAKDCYQVCAIYALEEAPNTLICGSYGSGKSLLTSAYAITYNNDKKTFISRPNLTVDRRFELGFLPGTLEDKLEPWMAGFMSSLYYIFGNTRGQGADNSVTYDFVKEQIAKKYFDMMPLDSLQGMSFMENDLLLLDEVQLCSTSILSIVLSRFGEGSKLIMTGDVKQTYGVIPPSENGLLKLLRLMPNKNLAYVELKNNYRSKLTEIANELQDRSIT